MNITYMRLYFLLFFLSKKSRTQTQENDKMDKGEEDQTSDWDNEDWESSNIVVKIPSSNLDDEEESPSKKKTVIQRVKSVGAEAVPVEDKIVRRWSHVYICERECVYIRVYN